MIENPEAVSDKRKYRATPVGIAKMLGIDLYRWQEKVLMDCMVPGKTAMVAANEAGKTTRIAAPLVAWFFLCFPKGKCVVTSGSWTQLETQLFPSISKNKDKFQGWTFNQTDFTTAKGGTCIGISTDNPGRFEGHHTDGKESPLLMIVDEGKTVIDGIYQAIARCRPTYLLIMSSSGLARGEFFNAFSKDSKFWRRHVITAADCPHISKQEVEQAIEKWGEHHPLIRSMIYSEFVDEADGQTVMIPLSLWNKAMSARPLERISEPIVFLDFAAGGDENVIYMRRGNKMSMVAAWREKDTMSAVGRFIMHLHKLSKEVGLKKGYVFGDAGGVGKAMCDRLGQGGWEVHEVNNGAAANDKEHFANRSAEMWSNAKMELEKGMLILEDDPELMSQLTTRHFSFDGKFRIKLESKEDLRSRGISSPDRADGFVGALCCQPIAPYNYVNEPAPWDEPALDEEEHHIPGAFAGI